MMNNQKKFHSSDGKRLILVADDEIINREMLSMILGEEYRVICAEDGEKALAAIREYHETLSLVILDLLMPKMHGLEVLKTYKSDPVLQKIPAIVMTAEQSSEVESLRLGAIDFIPKPYPQPEVILARVLRTIELTEDRDIIRSTERDALTGLYNREYFYRYAEQFDLYHAGVEMDAIVADVNHFHMINERYGKAYGDKVLRQVGDGFRETFKPSGGILCRREGDTFLIYSPHRDDYGDILENISAALGQDGGTGSRIRLRMGIYSRVDKSIDIERRFDRAKLAADSVRGYFGKTIAEYDSDLHEKELYAEQLLDEFHGAVEQHQFEVYYQPKFDIRPEIPVLSSAEALVRWKHPEMGMISPGAFIPLFERNGLIRELDHYVWREAAAQIKDWKVRLGYSVPISVNVSRIDMYDPNLIDTFSGILQEFDLSPSEFLLEITESAYTQDSEQIITVVNRLREMGFRIEMDDFGTGYSSLNMISRLPIDALKLDMQFIRNAFRERKDTRLLEVIIDIADYLSVPVIAEGVETEEQLQALREMGCDLVQGYYFSRPVPSMEYETFVVERRDLGEAGEYIYQRLSRKDLPEDEMLTPITFALSSGFDNIYSIDTENGHYVRFTSKGKAKDLQIEESGEDFFGEILPAITQKVYLPDQERVALTLKKDILLEHLASGQNFSITYRVPEEDQTVYYNLKAIRTVGGDSRHIVIGVSNVNEQVQQAIGEELGAIKVQANRDALTGVKNRQAYLEAEKDLNEAIELGVSQPFALVVCDLNDLKNINDTLGHRAGDQYIRSACSIICNIFKHSPVFRIGGDEFAVILRNSDYENRMELMRELEEKNQASGTVIVASGMAEYIAGTDFRAAEVFERADRAMYRNKENLKTEKKNNG